MGIRTDLLVTEEIIEPSDLTATPFEFERAKRVEAALSILEGKWKTVILNRLFARPVWRFSELERAVPGISQRMLSQQLRLLETCELVTFGVWILIVQCTGPRASFRILRTVALDQVFPRDPELA